MLAHKTSQSIKKCKCAFVSYKEVYWEEEDEEEEEVMPHAHTHAGRYTHTHTDGHDSLVLFTSGATTPQQDIAYQSPSSQESHFKERGKTKALTSTLRLFFPLN